MSPILTRIITTVKMSITDDLKSTNNDGLLTDLSADMTISFIDDHRPLVMSW